MASSDLDFLEGYAATLADLAEQLHTVADRLGQEQAFASAWIADISKKLHAQATDLRAEIGSPDGPTVGLLAWIGTHRAKLGLVAADGSPTRSATG